MTEHTLSRDERLSQIENTLFHNPDGLRVVELAKTCAVDRRTIYRDLAQLRANGVPVYRQDGRFFISRDYYLASVRFTIHEIIALFAAVRVMSQVAPQQSPHMISALARLGRALPPPIAPHVDQTAQHLRQTPVDRLFVSVLETLTRAWGEQRRVQVWHSHHLLDFAPYFFEVKATGIWYIVGAAAPNDTLHALNLRRISRAELQNTTFQRPPAFDSSPYLTGDLESSDTAQTPPVTITLAATPNATRQIIQDRRSVTLHEAPHADGREVISFTAHTAPDLLPWLRRFGPAIEVLAPLQLRDQLRQEAQQALAYYK